MFLLRSRSSYFTERRPRWPSSCAKRRISRRIRALLDLSASTIGGMAIALGVMGLTGLIMPFLIHIWDKIYIWASIVLIAGQRRVHGHLQ